MAKYAISEEGISQLQKLSKSIISDTENIYEAGALLKNNISSLGEGLGVYEDEIIDLVNHNQAALQSNREVFKQLSNSILKKADEICGLMGLDSLALGNPNGVTTPYRANRNNTNSNTQEATVPKSFNDSNQYMTIVDSLEKQGVEYRPIQMVTHQRSSDEIISRLSGGDLTEGSCSSLALAYAGNKAGYDVLDFRDGDSRKYFSSRDSIQKIADLPDVNSTSVRGFNDIESAHQLLEKTEKGKEYYMATGRHAAIVRRTDNGYEYLELQHPSNGNGWHTLDDSTLTNRFGCYSARMFETSSFLMDVESMSNSRELRNILGFINTADSDQRKGAYGNVR